MSTYGDADVTILKEILEVVKEILRVQQEVLVVLETRTKDKE